LGLIDFRLLQQYRHETDMPSATLIACAEEVIE
jgi:hypothetical protein